MRDFMNEKNDSTFVPIHVGRHCSIFGLCANARGERESNSNDYWCACRCIYRGFASAGGAAAVGYAKASISGFEY